MDHLRACTQCKETYPLSNGFYSLPKGFSTDCRKCRIKVSIKNKLLRQGKPPVRQENKEDANLGFIIRCKVADMVDQLEKPHRVVRTFSDEITLNHLETDYIAIIKIIVKKKHA